MNKTIIILITTLILLMSIASATVYWEDYFERADSGTVGNNWVESEGGSLTYEINSNTMLTTFEGASGTLTQPNVGVSITSDLEIEFEQKISTSSSIRKNFIQAKDQAGTLIFFLGFDMNGINNWEIFDGSYHILSTNDDGAYHTFNIKNLDTTTDTFDIYVDDILEISGLSMPAGSTGIGDIFFQTYSTAESATQNVNYFNLSNGVDPTPPVSTVNESTEHTSFVEQIGSVTVGGTMATIISSDFPVPLDDTNLYGGYSFNVEKTGPSGTNEVYCELLINSIVQSTVTRSNVDGEIGSIFLQTPVLNFDTGNYTQTLQCQRSSGSTSSGVEVSNSVGVAHLLYDQHNKTVVHNYTEVSSTVTSGASYTLLDTVFISIPYRNATNFSNDIVVEGFLNYENNGATEELNTYVSINDSNCSFYPRDVTGGTVGSVGFDCILDNVTAGQTYNVSLYGLGSNAVYTGNMIVKNLFLGIDEIVGGTGAATGLTFSDNVSQPLFSAPGGNTGHLDANVFTKLSYSLSSDIDTIINMWITIENGNNYSTRNFTRFLPAGETGVLIGHDVLQGLPLDQYNTSIWGNCGTTGATCTLEGGQSGGYITDVTTTIPNNFNVTAHEVTNNNTIINFSVIDGTTVYNTTNGLIVVSSIQPLVDLTIKANGYFGRLVEDHNTSTPLNVTMYPSIINITSPENNTFNNTMPTFSFIFKNGVWKGLTCDYYDNRTGSYTIQDTIINVGSLVDTEFPNVPTFPDSGTYSFFVGCEDNDYNSSVYEITYDITNPIITFVTPNANNNSFFSTNFSLDISVTDVNNYDAFVNITDPLGSLIFERNYNTSGEFVFNITDLINLSVNGEHTLFIEAADGHTARSINTFKTNYVPDGIKFNKEVAIYGYNNDYQAMAIKKDDRYSMSFIEQDENFIQTVYDGLFGYDQIAKEEGDPDKFIVETDQGTIDIVQDSDYLGHLIIKIGNDYNDWYWVDFENEQGAEVTLERISDNAVIVNVYGLGNYTFNSIGRLNVVNKTVRFYFDTSDIGLIATYEENIISGFETTYYLAATLNPVKYDLNETKTVTIHIDGDIYTPIENGSSVNTFYYYYPFTIPIDYNNPTIINQWYFETLDRTNATVQVTTGPLSQNVFNVDIGNCNDNLSYPVINFSYYDEIEKTALMANMNYDLSFFDGTYNYEAEGFFSGNFSNAICTNLNPNNVTYTWDVSGQVTLESDDDNYTTRVFTFSPDSPLSASNDDLTNQSLYLIKLADSQTVEYTWLSSSYDLLDGVMRVYRCNNDNTRSLVESVLITGGQSNANIELLTSSYAYDVVVNGQVYQEESYNVCHIEASQTITYYVTLTPQQLLPVSGLLFTGCSLSGPDNQSIVTMTWDDNSYDSTPITACIQGLRSTLGNNVLVFEDCSSQDEGTLQVIVPDNSNEYTIRGYLTQGNNSGYCSDYIPINENRDSGTILDQTGLFMIILLVLGIALYYSDNTTMSLSGTAVALLLAWIIGLTAFGWITTSSIVAFILIILYISRGSRKR